MDSDPNAVFLLSASFIRKPNLKKLKKVNRASGGPSVFNNLICGIKDLVKPQPRHPYRYSNNDSSESSSISTVKRSLTPELVNDDGKMSSNKFPSSVSSPNLSKQDSGSSTNSSSRPNYDLINLNESYGEKRMDERRMSGSRGGSGSSSANGENRTPKSKKRTVQLPNAPNRDSTRREITPSTILRLEDRDLVVIDKHDIKEAVSNESQVIIVDPPAAPTEIEHVDLGDILSVGEWPELQAGSVATLLNADKKSGAVSSMKTLERNKSANIASHFSSSKPRTGYENGNDTKSQKKSE